MNKLSTISTAIAMLVFAVGCSGNKSSSEDTIRVDSNVTPQLPEETVTDAQITGRGIGPVRLQMTITSLSPSVENLYDNIEKEGGYESNTYHFMLDGKPRFTVYEFESGLVDIISVDDSSVIVNNPDGEPVRIGESFSKVFGLNGVKPQWEAADDEGIWVWNWQGLWFQPDQSTLNEVLVHKLYNQNTPPTAADFSPDVKVGYIATGLPW